MMKKFLLMILALTWGAAVWGQPAEEKQPLENTVQPGYRSIWFQLGKMTDYGVKYSGGYGTYTAKHSPMAVYAPEVDKTFFVYGGTPSEKERKLLCMVGCFDHKTGMVCRPVVVYDKGKLGVNDPHDNPAIIIDSEGYLWVYVAGRGNKRPGHRFRSVRPYDISEFELQNSSIMAYPNPRYVPGKGHFLFFTRYDGVRQLFFQTSPDGKTWSDYRQIASIKDGKETLSGHYQIIGQCGNKLATAFNRHLNGACDTRTNIYYLQTEDFGQTWTTVDGTEVELPVTTKDHPCRVLEVESKGKNVYIKDVNFDADGNPLILYVMSDGFESGPANGPREWYVAHWTGKKWDFQYVTASTHNYDTGSIYVEGKVWRVIGPTEAGPQKWGSGGEVASWTSKGNGKWKKDRQYTMNSPLNHHYVRRPYDAKDPFYAYWADGNPDKQSICHLYFGDSKGNVWRLPYDMKDEWEKPEKVEFSSRGPVVVR
ncbi:MAG: BNR-4 repeat-containing protein [Candidatus Cryptobacteroides sp.]